MIKEKTDQQKEWERNKKSLAMILKEYTKNRSDLILNTVERDNLDCSPGAINYKAVISSASNRISSVVENFTIKSNDLKDQAKKYYKRVVLIEGALIRLTANQRKVIKMKYFDGYNYDDIAGLLHRDRTTVIRIRNAAFKEFLKINLINKYEEI